MGGIAAPSPASGLEGRQWLASRPYRLTCTDRAPSTHWAPGPVCIPCRESNPRRPSHSLSRLTIASEHGQPQVVSPAGDHRVRSVRRDGEHTTRTTMERRSHARAILSLHLSRRDRRRLASSLFREQITARRPTRGVPTRTHVTRCATRSTSSAACHWTRTARATNIYHVPAAPYYCPAIGRSHTTLQIET
jgi:hypothetical protein